MPGDDTSLNEQPETREPLEESQKKSFWPDLLEALPWAGRFVARESPRRSISFAGDIFSLPDKNQTVNPWRSETVEHAEERLAIIERELEQRQTALETIMAQTAVAKVELEQHQAALETARAPQAFEETPSAAQQAEAAELAATSGYYRCSGQ